MDTNIEVRDCIYHVEEWSRQIKQWIDADRANLELANQFIVGLGLVTLVQGLFLAPATRSLIPSDLRLATNLASLAVVIGIGGAFIGVASSMTFYARRETNSTLFNDLLQFRSDLVLILGWYEESLGDVSEHGQTYVNIGGAGGETNVHFTSQPAIRVIGTQGQTYLNIGGAGGKTKAHFEGGIIIDRTDPHFPDRRERLQRAKFFLQDVRRHCCFRSERRIIGNILDVVRILSRTPQTSEAQAQHRDSDIRVSPPEKRSSPTRVNITSVLFQALWFCLSISSTCFGTSTALFLGVMAPGGMIESIIRFSCFLIFPGIFIFLFFCQKSASPTSFSRTHTH